MKKIQELCPDYILQYKLLKHFTSGPKLKKHSPGMPGITQSMGGSDSKYLKHCIKKGKGNGLSYIQQKTKHV